MRHRLRTRLGAALLCGLNAGCATPAYSVRGTPVPEESASARQIELAISRVQGEQFAQEGARPLKMGERPFGFDIQGFADRIAPVTERPTLQYRVYLAQDKDPNAAALADGRIYVTTGMLQYLVGQPDATDKLAFVLSHELAHTVAQHLVKRYRRLQQQQVFMSLAAAGAAMATRGAGAQGQQLGQFALDIASLLNDVALSGYSQDQELEADQLGIRYVIRAGFRPEPALDLLKDFAKYEAAFAFLRTHPYAETRQEYLRRYLAEMARPGVSISTYPSHVPNSVETPPIVVAIPTSSAREQEVEQKNRQLRDAQKLYPRDSVSWKNLQRQIDALKR